MEAHPLPAGADGDQAAGDLRTGRLGARGKRNPAILASWAQLLSLHQVPAAMPGCIDYAGTVDGHLVTVWGITDRDVWETHFAKGFTHEDTGPADTSRQAEA